MADPALTISLAAEFVGKNAFKQADKATDKLSKNVKSLGRALGVTLGVGAILAFGKASVKAAAADEKDYAANQKTLSLSVSRTVEQLVHICAAHKKPRLLLKYITAAREKEKSEKGKKKKKRSV
jgi:hypothetical protein